ncbi:transposase [Methylovulum sp.]|uniref:REP-associated tyrosine transposase n=1 Tax=Methylovulum sp. TaxID=1916980 RepID=UPI00341D55A2
MTEYRRFRHPGTTWFFTLNLAGRRGNRLLTDRTDLLRAAFPHVKVKHPYGINASVVLPDHLHCILPLPDGDSDFSTRWGLIKAHFSRHLEKLSGFQKAVQNGAGEACTHGAWQRRFGEHLIRDEADYRQHIGYIHWNPVDHGWTQSVKDWPYSSFHRYVRRGVHPENWANDVNVSNVTAGGSDANDAMRFVPHRILGTPCAASAPGTLE